MPFGPAYLLGSKFEIILIIVKCPNGYAFFGISCFT